MKPLLIGVSARIYYPSQPVLDLGGVWTKTLHYLEQSVANWLVRGGALPVMIPALEVDGLMSMDDKMLRDYVGALDGLVLQGGNDVSPLSYGEQPLRPEWSGDPMRDRYEMQLIEAFVSAGKPIFGICRGLQVLNVAFGGTLYQDIPTQLPGESIHFDPSSYEKNFHMISLQDGGWMATLYSGKKHFRVNSIHHQGIKKLAPTFAADAVSERDGMIEAIYREKESFIAAVQWHPEFHLENDPYTLDDQPILSFFLEKCRARRHQLLAT